MLKQYLKRIYEIANRGDAREESYYSILEDLLKGYIESVDKRNIHITTLPKKTEAGNPDFRIWDGRQHIIGYIEAKAPTVEQLDHIQTTEQLKRYRHTFPNLILTNFFEFRLYRDGTLIDKVLIARPFIVHKLKAIPPVEKESDERFLRPEVLEILEDLLLDLKGATGFDQKELEKMFSTFLERHQIKLGKVAQPLRVALTGKTVSPGIFEIMEVMGQEMVIKRLSNAILHIKPKKGP